MVDLGVLVARDDAGPFRGDRRAEGPHRRGVRAGRGCRWRGSQRRSGRAGCRSCSWEASPVPAVGGALDADLPAGEPGDRGAPGPRSGRCWSRWGSPGWRPTSRSGRTSSRSCRCCSWHKSTGILDPAWLTRVGRAYAEGLRLAANVENEAYRARFTGSARASGADQQTAMELASQMAADFLPLVDRALMAIYRRQQELVWTEDLVEDTEDELERAGALRRPERVPAMSFLDPAGYTRLTEERGDPGGRRVGRDPDRAGRPVLARARRGAGEVVGRRGDVPFIGSPPARCWRRWEMVKELPEVGLPPARCSGSRRGRWWSRVATTSAAPSTWPPGSPPTPARGRSWSASAWPSRPPPRVWPSWTSGEIPLKGFPLPGVATQRPAGKERRTPPLCLGEACGCQVFGHLMRPARTHESAHQGDLVA